MSWATVSGIAAAIRTVNSPAALAAIWRTGSARFGPVAAVPPPITISDLAAFTPASLISSFATPARARSATILRSACSWLPPVVTAEKRRWLSDSWQKVDDPKYPVVFSIGTFNRAEFLLGKAFGPGGRLGYCQIQESAGSSRPDCDEPRSFERQRRTARHGRDSRRKVRHSSI